MKIKLLCLILSIAAASCNGQVAQSETQDVDVDWALQPESPSKATLDKWCTIQIKEVTRKKKETPDGCDLYYFKNELCSGWACKIIPDNPHKFRYEQFENGIMIRRVSYYDNGQIDGDFRMKNCKNYGPSRMWLYDGRLYIDEFYNAPGIPHGIQKQWYDNGVLAKESKFDNGNLVYEKRFDRNGNLMPPED